MEYPSNQILQQMKERAEKKSHDIKENNKELLQLPNWLTDEEKCAYNELVEQLRKIQQIEGIEIESTIN